MKLKNYNEFLNESKSSKSFSKKKLDKHVLAFLVKYGPNYIDNDGSIAEYLQNTDEDHSGESFQEELKKALLDARSIHESKLD